MGCRDVTGRALGLVAACVLLCGCWLVSPQALAQRAQSPLEIGGISHTVVDGLSIVVVLVENTGETQLDASGELELVDAAGQAVSRRPVSTGAIPAGETSVVAIPLGKALAAGRYTVTLTLVDDVHDVRANSGLREIVAGAVEDEPTPFPESDVVLPAASDDNPGESGFPSWLLLLIGVTLTVAGLVYMRAGSRYRKPVRARPIPNVSMIRKVKINALPPKRPATIKPLLPPGRRRGE